MGLYEVSVGSEINEYKYIVTWIEETKHTKDIYHVYFPTEALAKEHATKVGGVVEKIA